MNQTMQTAEFKTLWTRLLDSPKYRRACNGNGGCDPRLAMESKVYRVAKRKLAR